MRYKRIQSRLSGNTQIAASGQTGHDRWLVSYADFMTLLMAFFVVMYSISQVSEQKYRVLSATFSEAFNAPIKEQNIFSEGQPQYSHTNTPIDLDGRALEDRPGNDANEVPETFTRIAEQLEQSFQSLVEKDLIVVAGDERWLQIDLPSEVLFSSGGVQMSEAAAAIIDDIAMTLIDHNNVIRVEGFTDDVPINTVQFESNWELSTARAAAVVKQLVNRGIEPERLAAIGYGEFQPAQSNSTEAGRSKNRRIVLMVSTRNRLRPDAAQVDDLIIAPTPIIESAADDVPLVRGLERSAMDEARAWLSDRYPEAVVIEPSSETEESAESPSR
jgi:chemotaxis protein MotB